MLIRDADADADRDAAACAAIYAPSVTHGVISMEEVAPDGAELRRRITEITARYPWLVAEIEGVVAGYAYAGTHRARASYRWSTDVTVYVSAGHQRRGVGRALYARLFERLAQQGYHEACAGITLPNDASVGLHESLGFVPVGVYRNIAFKSGAWRDVGWWQKTLREHVSSTPPAEPSTPPPPGR
jgi:L-amino acid N-acyltransferase YncA